MHACIHIYIIVIYIYIYINGKKLKGGTSSLMPLLVRRPMLLGLIFPPEIAVTASFLKVVVLKNTGVVVILRLTSRVGTPSYSSM